MDEKLIFKVFGETLRETRVAKGLSQEHLAFESGFDRTFISRMERGLTQPTLVTLIRLSHACGISLSEFVAPIESKIDT